MRVWASIETSLWLLLAVLCVRLRSPQNKTLQELLNDACEAMVFHNDGLGTVALVVWFGSQVF
jgi:hypothetical protein